LIVGLISDFRNAAEIDMEVPTLIHRQIHNVTHHQTDEALVADQKDIFSGMLLSLLFKKICNALTGFLSGLSLWEAEVC
jgi:hypothetical protein